MKTWNYNQTWKSSKTIAHPFAKTQNPKRKQTNKKKKKKKIHTMVVTSVTYN